MLRITDTQFDKLCGWRPQPMDMRLNTAEGVSVYCPCCGTFSLRNIAGIYCQQLVTIGECEGCGYLGYTRRPIAEWFDKFYASDWDAAGHGARVDLSRCETHPITRFVPQIFKPYATLCDVGCGFGVAAWQMKRLGYHAMGVEKCRHRRDVALAHGILTADAVSKIGTFDIITAHHVLEHSVDPDAFIAEIAEHQDEGGILYISVPNQRGEPALGCLLFLPHLHSFTSTSLCSLAARHGYRLIANIISGFNLELAFVKQKPFECVTWEGLTSAVEKLSRAAHANGQGPLLSWCGNLSDAWFTAPDRFAEWSKTKWKPRAVRAERVGGPGRFPVELEVPCLFVK